MLLGEPTGEAAERLVQRQCCDARLHRIVFVGQRRPEDRHDPVAAHAVDRPPTAVDDVDEHWRDAGLESIGQVRLEAVNRIGQAGHHGDQDGDALPLAAEVSRFARAVPRLSLGGAGPARERSACCQARPRGRSGSDIELGTRLRGERERFGQTTGRVALGSADGALEILDGAHADPGPLGEGGLGEPGVQSMLAEQIAERGGLAGIRHHALHPLGSVAIAGGCSRRVEVASSAHCTVTARACSRRFDMHGEVLRLTLWVCVSSTPGNP